MARAVVEATAHFTDADLVAKVSTGLGEAMTDRRSPRSGYTWPSVVGVSRPGPAGAGGLRCP